MAPIQDLALAPSLSCRLEHERAHHICASEVPALFFLRLQDKLKHKRPMCGVYVDKRILEESFPSDQ